MGNCNDCLRSVGGVHQPKNNNTHPFVKTIEIKVIETESKTKMLEQQYNNHKSPYLKVIDEEEIVDDEQLEFDQFFENEH
jgi:hypothetical protein